MSPVAVLLVILSAFLHAAWNTATKGSARPTAFLVCFDGLTTAVLALPVVWFGHLDQLSTTVWALVLSSGVVHGFYGFWLTRAYEAGDLHLVYPIARSTPAFVPLAAVPLLGDDLSPLGILGILLVVASLWCMQLDSLSGRLRLALGTALGFAVLTLLSTVAYSLLDRAIMQHLDQASWSSQVPRAIVVLFLIQIVYLPVLALLAGRRVAPSALSSLIREQRYRIGVAALGSFVSYVLILEALRHAPVSYVVAIRQSSVLFALLFGVLWLRERATPWRLVGTLGSVAGVALIALFG